jgi:hypothetical protein
VCPLYLVDPSQSPSLSADDLQNLTTSIDLQELSTRILAAGQTILKCFVAAHGDRLGGMVRRGLNTKDWITRKEPRKPSTAIVFVIEEVAVVRKQVAAALGERQQTFAPTTDARRGPRCVMLQCCPSICAPLTPSSLTRSISLSLCLPLTHVLTHSLARSLRKHAHSLSLALCPSLLTLVASCHLAPPSPSVRFQALSPASLQRTCCACCVAVAALVVLVRWRSVSGRRVHLAGTCAASHAA